MSWRSWGIKWGKAYTGVDLWSKPASRKRSWPSLKKCFVLPRDFFVQVGPAGLGAPSPRSKTSCGLVWSRSVFQFMGWRRSWTKQKPRMLWITGAVGYLLYVPICPYIYGQICRTVQTVASPNCKNISYFLNWKETKSAVHPLPLKWSLNLGPPDGNFKDSLHTNIYLCHTNA